MTLGTKWYDLGTKWYGQLGRKWYGTKAHGYKITWYQLMHGDCLSTELKVVKRSAQPPRLHHTSPNSELDPNHRHLFPTPTTPPSKYPPPPPLSLSKDKRGGGVLSRSEPAFNIKRLCLNPSKLYSFCLVLTGALWNTTMSYKFKRFWHQSFTFNRPP